ncbi:metallophosphoesterase [Nocardiopsis algeriensis]|uniref:DNA repair exonuclease SbcCD nuclease subunit n=1 Tax=Nocardiopsis algeriensis TaxID=1478215 RepID=A0A841IKM2_9ACTN|nr:DNA repair exonuclease SbcCD nuclease subunit [Nocardiopsis algeriensis]
MRLLHAADLHIDSPMRGLVRYPGAPDEQLRTAARDALRNLVDLALEEQVTAVLLAGDVYDGTWRDVSTGLFFTAQMERLQEADVPVFMISGNHDAENKMTMSLRLPANVHRFGSREAATVVREDLGLAVHGQSFGQADVRDNLAASYPGAHSGLFNVGLLHTALEGDRNHSPYAPCSLEQLVNHGYDYWALGHIHKRSVEHGDGVHVVFPGNLQGRHAQETGAKGCTLVTVDGASGAAALEHRDLDSSARWHEVRVDMGGAADMDDACVLVEKALAEEVADSAREGRVDAVRVVATGASEAHPVLSGRREEFTANVRQISQQGHFASVWVEKVRVATRRPDRWLPPEQVADLVEDLREEGARLGSDSDRVRRLVESTRLRTKLPRELTDVFDDGAWAEGTAREAVEALTVLLEGNR